ncbi:hypothetical protein I1A62_30035 [Rhodococcus sp. USK10]|uniref:hypothetical protein n=1 Tax=Rhodococcus sp. USK10 TaxID=2789739 RepID=UPI001C5F91F8|nr:hypothetical protein [Rhodococcus sp. USK10]QYB01473.1 hypothetical protein I1A62_30035 [Rhodococcus sp. USK10]
MVRRVFACKIPIQYEEFTETGGEDENGNAVSALLPAVERKIFGAEPPTSNEPQLVGHDRVIVQIKMYADADDDYHPRDVVTLPRFGRLEVIGFPEDPNLNRWWQPGLITVNLRRVVG